MEFFEAAWGFVRKYKWWFIVLAVLIVGKISFHKAFKRIQIKAGHKGVVVHQPIFFGKGGVERGYALTPDSYWMWQSNSVYEINIQPQQAHENFEDMMTADNIPVDFEGFLNFNVTDVISFFADFGNGWYDANVKQTFRTLVRDECKKYKMAELISSPKVSNDIEVAVLAGLQKHIAAAKIPVALTKVNIGKINPNKEVLAEINATAIQQQRQRTERERKLAEDQRKETERSKAAADNAYRENMHLDPEQFLRLRAITAYADAAAECAKSDACMMVMTQPGAGNVNLPIPSGRHK